MKKTKYHNSLNYAILMSKIQKIWKGATHLILLGVGSFTLGLEYVTPPQKLVSAFGLAACR